MIGIHIKANKLQTLKTSLKYAKSIGCTHVQLFGENISSEMKLKQYLRKINLIMVIHAPYIINIASNFEPYGWRTKYLFMEIDNAIVNGAIGIVIHMGKKLNLSIETAYRNMYNILESCCKRIKSNQNFYIYLETTAGQGSELCWKLEDLAQFFDMIKLNKKMERIKICLDTCHLFCAGYDIRTKKGVDNFTNKFDKLIGVDRVGLMHINDSSYGLGTHKDRHLNLGTGFININGIRHFYKFFANRNVPGILETPIENYENEIKLLLQK
jgi:deoxyribonuclease-4